FGARPFILCGLPIRRLSAGTLTYRRRNGRIFLEIVGHPDYGVPFGQDRLIPLWVATQPVRQGTPPVGFESGSQIHDELGLPQERRTLPSVGRWLPADFRQHHLLRNERG